MAETMEHNLELIRLITAEVAWKYRVFPYKDEGGVLVLLSDIGDKSEVKGVQNQLFAILGTQVKLAYADSSRVDRLLTQNYVRQDQRGTVRTVDSGSNFLEQVLIEAKAMGSSDIHVEAFKTKRVVRFRVDGQLIERFRIAEVDYPGIVNQIKVKAELDISEKRLPQDGRISAKLAGSSYDIRVSILPGKFGEKAVLRLLNTEAEEVDIQQVGMSEDLKSIYLREVRKPNGIILISGPTGSGKTTTLYATLKILNQPDVNILTIEDPVEYTLDGITQVQLKEDIGMNFPRALRSFLRQDPDIIMVGEIRDVDTAEMAIRASLTGHLVLSTIHTNSAIGTITRLIDMGIPPFLLAETLNLSVAQRLIRLLCPDCKKLENDGLAEKLGIKALEKSELYQGVGCSTCYYTGYKGRTAIFELLAVSNEVRQAIRRNQVQDLDVETHLHSSLRKSAIDLLSNGLTDYKAVEHLLL